MKRTFIDQNDDQALVIEIGRSRKLRSGVSAHVARRSRTPVGARGGHPSRGRSAPFVRPSSELSRRCVVKVRIVQMTDYGKKAAALHIRYIERDGVERNGDRGDLYGPNASFDRDFFLREIPEEPHQFRFILSPEDAGDVSLTDFTRVLMSKLETDLGREVEWGAVNHYNTDNPHTHVVMRGVDVYGRELRINREYIKHGFRRRSCEWLTQQLGQRQALDIERERRQEVTKEGYSSIDYQLSRSSVNGWVDVDYLDGRLAAWMTSQVLLDRLHVLAERGLAFRSGRSQFTLSEGWEERLRGVSKREDIFKHMRRRIGGDPTRYRIADSAAKTVIHGRVIDKGLSDELYDKQYLIVDGVDGWTYYVDVGRSPSAAALRQSAIVEVKSTRALHEGARERKPVATIYTLSDLSLDEQETYRGLVWIDQFLQSDLNALPPHGFGALVRGAVRQRLTFIEGLGIDRQSASLHLNRLERSSLIKERESYHSMVCKPMHAGDTFHGKLHALPRGPNGRRFAEIINTHRQELVVVGWSSAWKSLEGKQVALLINERGRPVVAEIDKTKER